MNNTERNNENKHLAWFLGPKGENSDFFIKTLTSIIQDYIHWRRNYYPGDTVLINKKLQRKNEEEYDRIYQENFEILSQLRRNFPFYSPRYIGHMLSDVNMPSIFGYFAGMLHNSNNVTPEAAPVTVEWEIEACNEILKMLGYKESPTPPSKDADLQAWKSYRKAIKEEFGWSHITSGGTVANIEALWVARIIKYFPLAIQDIAINKKIDIEIKLPNSDLSPVDIKNISKEDLLFIKPNEAIYLLSKFIDAVAKKDNIDVAEASINATKLLESSKYSLSNNLGAVFSEFPPVIFTSGAAHYSIKKAADIIGIGRSNVVIVNTDSNFRLDIKDLKAKIEIAIKSGKYPLAVVGVGSTTEEGAVDPIHEIVNLREEFELQNKSFWIHIDSAWGGYISSILKLDEDEELKIKMNKIARKLELTLLDNKSNSALDPFTEIINETKNKLKIKTNSYEDSKIVDNFKNKLDDLILNIKTHDLKIKESLEHYKKIILSFGNSIYLEKNLKLNEVLKRDDFEININDRVISTADFASENINFSLNSNKKFKIIKWGSQHVISSYLAYKKADSITVDPHKLGYVQYPCGIIAFKNDRVRHFIMQRAPYITSSGHNALLHNPPRHVQNIDFKKLAEDISPINNYQIAIDAFAPFTLEGSKPGAAAAALWFSIKAIPLNRRNHGLIIRDSILAARELYEWIHNWEKIREDKREDEKLYEFKTFGNPPDTNVLVFAVKNSMKNTIESINELTESVYNHFSIQAELGAKDHSYSQSFFISKTKMDNSHYDYTSFKSFFEDCKLKDSRKDYMKHGLVILRATLMNPYISSIRRSTEQNLLKEFVLELHKAANISAKEILKKEKN